MAVTRIWAIKSGELANVLDYITDLSKTDEQSFSDPKLMDMYNALNYVGDETKTSAQGFDPSEKRLFVTGINCIPENAKQEMTDTKLRFDKTGGILAYHAYQSFKPDEVTPELAHKIGVETARKLWGDKYEVIVATHMGSHAIHNHMLCNSVSFVDGEKYNGCKENYNRFREVSDSLCREYELSVIEHPEGKRVPYNVYKAQQNGEPTKNDRIKKDIDFAISVSGNMNYFEKVMKLMGYEFRRGCKYEYIFHAMVPKGVRLIHLGEDYTFERIDSRIHDGRLRFGVQFDRQDDIGRFFETPPWEYVDLCSMYVNFVAVIDIVKDRRQYNLELFRALWEEELIFDKRVEEQNLMLDHDLKTDEDVQKFKSECEKELSECDDARRMLRNALKRAERAENPEEEVSLRRDISSLTAAMANFRKQIRICDRILDDAPEIEKQMKYIRERAEAQRQRNRNRNDRER